MVNKKGFLRVIEATIAVLIVIGALLLIATQQSSADNKDLTKILPPLLDEIARDPTLRESVLSMSPEDAESFLENFFEARINNPSFEKKVRVCDLSEECLLDPFPIENSGDTFVAERIISTSLSESGYSPRRIRVFLWKVE